MALTNALTLDGSSQYVWRNATGEPLPALSVNYTAESWCYITGSILSGYHTIIDNGVHGGGGVTNFSTGYEGGGTSKFQHTMYAGGAFKHLVCNDTIVIDTWYHVAIVWDGSEFRAYVNGVKQTSTFTFASHDTNSYKPSIGAWNNNGTFTYFFNGKIDEVRVSNSVRYTDNFTPSTTEFASDGSTVSLFHLNADGDDVGPNDDDMGSVGTPTFTEGHVDDGGGGAPAATTPTPTALLLNVG